MTVMVFTGDCRAVLRDMPAKSVQCVVTSPPYFGLRDYGVAGQIGLEQTPAAYVAELVAVFADVWRVLRDDGTCWLNLGDSYTNDTKWGGQTSGKHARANHGDTGIGRRRHKTGIKSKNLMGVPWRTAFALQDAGWCLRRDIIWAKPNPMPESVTDRPTTAHEYVFLLTKRPKYFYDAEAVKEVGVVPAGTRGAKGSAERAAMPDVNSRPPEYKTYDGMRHCRSVWTIQTRPFKGAHFATFPPELAERCVKAGSRPGDTILDPFGGAGTVGLVAEQLQRHSILIELNPAYVEIMRNRLPAGSVADMSEFW